MSEQKSGWRSFWAGLVEPSAPALATALGTAVTIAALALTLVGPATIAAVRGYLAYGPHDDGLEATAGAATLSASAHVCATLR